MAMKGGDDCFTDTGLEPRHVQDVVVQTVSFLGEVLSQGLGHEVEGFNKFLRRVIRATASQDILALSGYR
jgi:hypothetical protein